MKKKVIWILAILLSVLTLLTIAISKKNMNLGISSPMNLTYVLTEERGTVSFNPIHSDTLLNLTFEEQIIGTLVKNNNKGFMEPFLAESWETHNNGRTWVFKLKPQLTCEDGTPITTQNFTKGFTTLLRQYLKNNKWIPVFEQLEGFDEFRKGNPTISGFKSNDNSIEFNFKVKPDAILEFLSMPYYGFYCEGNFNKNGEWADENKLISSGSYSVHSKSANEVILRKRDNWPTHVEGSASQVNVKMMSFEEARQLPANKTIIQRRIKDSTDLIPEFTKFLSTPTDLLSIVLSHKKSGSPFVKHENRVSFRNTIRQFQKNINLNSETSILTSSFFQGAKAPQSSGQIAPKVIAKAKLTTVVTNAIPSNIRAYIEELLTKAGQAQGFEIIFQNEDRSKPGWKERLDELTDFDIRVARVDIGSAFGTGVVNMMFCSQLGVSFPDPRENICKLVKEILHAEREIQLNDGLKFEELVFTEASVIPVLHTSHSWLISNDIHINQFSPTSNFMRFDLISLK